MKRPDELEREIEAARARLAGLTQNRATLLRETITAVRGGKNPNGARAALLEADAEIDILRGTIEAIESEMPDARRASAAERSAEIMAQADAVREEAAEVAGEVFENLRAFVAGAQRLGSLGRAYQNAVQEARGLAKGAGIREPGGSDDLLAVAFPPSPEQWGLGHRWRTLLNREVMGALEQFVAAVGVAERWAENTGANR